MSVTLGWWAIPTAITIAAFWWASLYKSKPAGPYSVDPMPILRGGAAIIVSLVAWLAYAIAF